MTYEEWLETVSEAVTGDALWRMEVYRLSLFAQYLAHRDSEKLVGIPGLRSLADQLVRAVGSIGANIAEGYSRSSHRDQARFYEYALGSAREARHWYLGAEAGLGTAVVRHRIDYLASVIRQLLRITRHHRGVSEAPDPYSVPSPLLEEIPYADDFPGQPEQP